MWLRLRLCAWNETVVDSCLIQMWGEYVQCYTNDKWMHSLSLRTNLTLESVAVDCLLFGVYAYTKASHTRTYDCRASIQTPIRCFNECKSTGTSHMNRLIRPEMAGNLSWCGRTQRYGVFGCLYAMNSHCNYWMQLRDGGVSGHGWLNKSYGDNEPFIYNKFTPFLATL